MRDLDEEWDEDDVIRAELIEQDRMRDMTLDELSEKVARRAFRIEMAGSCSGSVVGVHHVVRSALIAMRKMGLIDFA